MSTFPHTRSREEGLGFPPDPASAPGPWNATRGVAARIGKYEVEAEVGEGSRIRVFRAFDRSMDRRVTLKVLTDVADKALGERFRREVAIAARLRHAGIIAIYELGEHVGLPFAAMQHLEGEDLQQAIGGRRALTLLEKMLIMWQVAEGMRAAHRGGLAHVGLRPAGIVLGTDGNVTVQDFGTVRATGAQEESGLYLAPEAAAGGVADAQCDIFVFGAVYYELLTGTYPREPGKLRRLAPECPEELERIVYRTLEKPRELRYHSLDDVQFDTEPILRELKRTHAAALLADASRMAEEREPELDEALALLRKILELDPDNPAAHHLHASLRGDMQRRYVRSRVDGLLREAEEAAGTRQFTSAIESLKAALELEDTAQTRTKLETVRGRLERSQKAAGLLAEARRLLEQRKLADAEQRAWEALEADSETSEAAELLESIEDAIRREQREARVEEELAKAKSMLLLEQFDEALGILEGLRRDYPETAGIDDWLAHVSGQKTEAARRARTERQLKLVRSLMAEQRFGEAADLVDELTEEFPDAGREPAVLGEVRTALERVMLIERTAAYCDQLCREGLFDKAIEGLDAALTSLPGEAALVALLRQVEQQRLAAQTTSAVCKALDEVQWLLDQDRPDLAVDFLNKKLAELPEQAALGARAAEVKTLLAEWEERRFVQGILARVAALEQLQQWQVAVTVVEEALGTYPESAELLAAAERVRERLRLEERQKKLARRLELIGQKIAARSWTPALTLIEATQAEFPGEPELGVLLEQVRAGRRRSDCENIIADVRHCLADGDTEQADQILQIGREALPGEPALQALLEEIESGKKYREDLRAAQLFFGRRQLQEAERILTRLAGPNHPEAMALLDMVRGARAANEEENFYERSREKALKLMEERQYAQAADLLGNLLALFPGDPIVQRDLALAQAGLEKEGRRAGAVETPAVAGRVEPAVAFAAAAAAAAPARAAETPPQKRPAPVKAGPRLSRGAIAVGALLVVSGSTAAWKLTRGGAAAERPERPAAAAVTPAASASATVPAPVPDTPAKTEETQTARKPAEFHETQASRKTTEVASVSQPVRPFVPPPGKNAPQQAQAPLLVPPPGTVAIVSEVPTVLAGDLGKTVTPPAPPAQQTAQQTVAAPPPARAIPPGGKLQEARPVSRPLPEIPSLALSRGLSGPVKLEATVDVSGAVTNVKIKSGDPVLALAARNAVMRWRYQPATLNDKPIETKLEIQVLFGGRTQ